MNESPIVPQTDTPNPAPVPTTENPVVSTPSSGTITPIEGSNSPVAPSISNAHSIPGKDQKPKSKSPLGKGFYLGCLGFVVFLIAAFIVLAVVALRQDPNNSFLIRLGLGTTDVRGIVSTLINIGFGFISLILLVVVVIGIFRALLFRSPEKSKRITSLIALLFSFIALVGVLVGWVVVYKMIGTTIVQPVDTTVAADIVAYSTVDKQAVPIPTLGLTAPISLLLSAENVTKKAAAIKGIQVLNYQWDLNGDGKFDENQTGEKVQWTYEDKGKNGGQYTVTMRVTILDDKGQVSTKDYTKPITVASVKPKIVLKVTPETGEGPLTVNMDASDSVDPDGQYPKDLVISWNWSGNNAFNDATGPKVSHIFQQIGEYTIQVRVQDRDGLFTIDQKKIQVTAIKQDIPQVKAQANQTSGKPPITIQFTSEGTTSPNGKIVSYEWDFGDGTPTMRGVNTSHTYTHGGKFTAKLKATDELQREGTAEIPIVIDGPSSPPKALIKTNPPVSGLNQIQKMLEGPAPFNVTFDATQSSDPDQDIIDYQWDFDGDGVFETRGAKPEPMMFYEPGDKTITLKVIDSAQNVSTDTIIIRVKTRPIASIIKATPLSGSAPLLVSFDGSASRYDYGNIVQYEWDFNDGAEPKVGSAQIKYTFTKTGTYKVKLTILTNDGKKESSTQNIVVTEIPLLARFEPSINKGVAPLSVTFDPASSTGKIANFDWDFGDGVQSTERKPSHSFTSPGNYTVVLTVRDKDGVTSQYAREIIVE